MTYTREKTKKITWFFLNGEIHKTLHVNRAADTIKCFNYIQQREMTYVYSDVLKRYGHAWRTKEVAEILNCSHAYLKELLNRGKISRPQKAITKNGWSTLFWQEQDIYDLHEYFSTVHAGKQRKDGEITPFKGRPSKREVRAKLRNEEILYIKVGDKMVPTWRAENIF